MIKTRLLGLVPDSKKYIAGNVLFQWFGLIGSIVMVITIANLLSVVFAGEQVSFAINGVIIVCTLMVRIFSVKLAQSASYHASKSVKKTLRGMIYEKLLELGGSYTKHITTAEIVQLSGEGVEQLETYFGNYMPQFFYAFLAPITLFFVVRTISVKVAVVLVVCVVLIPMAIAVVQKIAKRLLSKYWGQYATLGDNFLENLQGLTTLKIYQADEARHREMNKDAEHFREITMKVLTMQLNSIIVMDIVAYGGAALGILLSALELRAGRIDFAGCFTIILLSADFFLPMRQLGSYFHVAMNGMAASDKIFAFLDIPVSENKTETLEGTDIEIKNMSFEYDEGKDVLSDINIEIPKGSFLSFVGESGCGKSTLAGILMGRNEGYIGEIKLGGKELSSVNEAELMKRITYISHNSYVFKGTVKDNLLMGNANATESMLWDALSKVKLAEFLKTENGLATELLEAGGAYRALWEEQQRLENIRKEA